MSNEEKAPSELPEEAKETWEKVEDGVWLDGGLIRHGVTAEVLSAGADDGPSEVVHERKSWRDHVVEEPDPGSGGRVRRTLRRWFRR
jgi:hypothetical protein